jgi:membrane-associated phospholipid phosphatase
MEPMGGSARAPDTLRLALVAVAAAVAVYALAVGTGLGRAWDERLVEMAVDGGERRTAIAVARAVNPATAVLAVLAVAFLAGRRGGRPAALAAVAISGGAPIAAVALEWGLGELDPTGGEQARALGSAYFPSGHATVGMAVVLAVLFAIRDDRWRVRPAVAGIAVALLAAPHFLIGWHHPSDVLGGVLLAVAWAAAVAHVVLPDRQLMRSSGNPFRRGLAVVAMLLTAAAVAADGLPVPAPAILAALAVAGTAAWGAVAFAAATAASPERRTAGVGARRMAPGSAGALGDAGVDDA